MIIFLFSFFLIVKFTVSVRSKDMILIFFTITDYSKCSFGNIRRKFYKQQKQFHIF